MTPTSSKVLMFSTAICPFCIMARRLLSKKGVQFEDIRIDQDPDQRPIMEMRSKRTSVPQIFIGDRHIGGYTDMEALDRSGELDKLLKT